MGTTPRETAPESEKPFEGPRLHIADLPEGTRFKIVGGDNQILTVADAATGRVRITPFQTATVDKRAIVEVVELPNIDTVKQDQDRKREQNLAAKYPFKSPTGLVRVVQTTHRDQLERIVGQGGVLPVYGPDLNSLNRNDKQAQWKDIPTESFFTKAPNNPDAGVFLKTSEVTCFLVCKVAEWRSGKTKKFSYRGSDDKLLNKIGLDNDSEVTVLNAPSAVEVQQEVDAWRQEHPHPTDTHEEHLKDLVDRARNFHQKSQNESAA